MHVAITGASSGIGAALARELARAGHALTLVARRRDLLDALAAEVGGGAFVVAHDLADASRATAWVAAAEAAHGPIDVLVNNAGMENTGPSHDADPDVCRRLIELNLTTPLLLTRHLLPAMRERRRGLFVNVASVAALVPLPRQTYYGGSKAGLAAFSESLRGELLGTGVDVLTVYPGPVATAMGEAGWAGLGGRDNLPKMPEGTPEVLASRIRRAMERRRARLVYPRFYAVSRWLPWFGRWSVDSFAPRPR
jgi:short-subunit dehydrogenase